MPRFTKFLSRHPEVTVNFTTRLDPFDFRNENLHAAIHYGEPDWPDCECTYLMGEEVVAVCSPELYTQYRNQEPSQLSSAPLLSLSSRPNAWREWFEDQGVETEPEQGMQFEQFSIIAQAAAAGLGVALIPQFLIRSELDRGELRALESQTSRSHSGYYFVTPKNRAEHAPTAAFRDWLLEEVHGEAVSNQTTATSRNMP